MSLRRGAGAFFVLASVRVTGSMGLHPVGRITTRLKVRRSRMRGCNHCVTGVAASGVSAGGFGGRRLVLIATVDPAGTNGNGAAMSMNLTLNVRGVNGGTIITLHRPSLKPYFNVGNNTTNNNCTRMLPVSGVGLRFANSFRTVARTGGVVTTLLSGCHFRRRTRNFGLGGVL